MIETIKALMLACFLLFAMVMSSQAIFEQDHHYLGTEDVSSSSSRQEMMMGKMQMKNTPELRSDMPCKEAGYPCNGPCRTTSNRPARHHMKGAGMSNMLTMDHGMMRMNPDIMHQGMKREFFLDRIESLGLTPDQVSKLKTIRTDCRKENIRNAAEVQILRLDLEELLSNSDWAFKATEPLIRKIKNLEGNMLVRHLQAIAEARNVLSSEQLQKTISGGENEALEDLF